MSEFDWDSQTQTVIAAILLNGINTVVEIDARTGHYELVSNKTITWADKHETGSLIFMDHMGRIWQQGSVEDTLIEPLIGQGSSKGFVVTGDLVYGINKNDQLWSFNLADQAFTTLANLGLGGI